MGNLYKASSLTCENDGITIQLEGVSVAYLEGLKLLASTVSGTKTSLIFQDKARKRTNIVLEASAGSRDSWFELIAARKLILKDYKNELVEAEAIDDVYGITHSVVQMTRAINLQEGVDPAREQSERLREDFRLENSRLEKMKRRAGIK